MSESEDKQDMSMTNYEIEQRIRELGEENIDFIINVNNIIGNLGPKNFHGAVNAISTALFVLQKENSHRHTINIMVVANKILKTQNLCSYELNRAEIICLLYYIQQNMETIQMSTDTDEIPTWSIREDIFKNLCDE
jgi:hypothetical protein